MTTRIERDSMGEMSVPADALYGATTQRAVENFPVSGRPLPRAFIRALGLIKEAAAVANADLGEDVTGLTHSFVDSTVTNGIQYFYAVVAYDFGAPSANISPTETPRRIRRAPDGTITTGPNVVAVTPVARVRELERRVLTERISRIRGKAVQ